MTTEILETEVVELTDIAPYVDDDDPLRRTHIIRDVDNPHISMGVDMSAQDIVDTARLMGTEVIALCGYKFVPQHNPEKYDACQPCIKVATDIWNAEG